MDWSGTTDSFYALRRDLYQEGLVSFSSRLYRVTPTGERILATVPEEILISFQFLGYALSEDFCHAKAPECPECPARPMCPSSSGFIKAQKEAAKKESAARKAEKTRSKAKK